MVYNYSNDIFLLQYKDTYRSQRRSNTAVITDLYEVAQKPIRGLIILYLIIVL